MFIHNAKYITIATMFMFLLLLSLFEPSLLSLSSAVVVSSLAVISCICSPLHLPGMFVISFCSTFFSFNPLCSSLLYSELFFPRLLLSFVSYCCLFSHSSIFSLRTGFSCLLASAAGYSSTTASSSLAAPLFELVQ